MKKISTLALATLLALSVTAFAGETNTKSCDSKAAACCKDKSECKHDEKSCKKGEKCEHETKSCSKDAKKC